MAFEFQSFNRRSLGPAIASAVVGIAAGVVAVIGVATLSGTHQIPSSTVITSDQALLGGSEYGTRN